MYVHLSIYLYAQVTPEHISVCTGHTGAYICMHRSHRSIYMYVHLSVYLYAQVTPEHIYVCTPEYISVCTGHTGAYICMYT